MTEPVSRETPPAPSAAQGVFCETLELAERYAGLLATDGVDRGLLGPREVGRLWERHLLNCAVLADAIPAGSTVCDIGSGAGLPGIVLALRRTDLSLTLVEPLLRRVTFLSEVVDTLGLTNVEVVRARAEELHGSRDFDVVTSRAVAPLSRLLAWSMPLVRTGGALLAMKGASAGQEVEEADTEIGRHTSAIARVEEYGVGQVYPPTVVVRVEATRSAPLRLSSRSGSEPRAPGTRRGRGAPG